MLNVFGREMPMVEALVIEWVDADGEDNASWECPRCENENFDWSFPLEKCQKCGLAPHFIYADSWRHNEKVDEDDEQEANEFLLALKDGHYDPVNDTIAFWRDGIRELAKEFTDIKAEISVYPQDRIIYDAPRLDVRVLWRDDKQVVLGAVRQVYRFDYIGRATAELEDFSRTIRKQLDVSRRQVMRWAIEEDMAKKVAQKNEGEPDAIFEAVYKVRAFTCPNCGCDMNVENDNVDNVNAFWGYKKANPAVNVLRITCRRCEFQTTIELEAYT